MTHVTRLGRGYISSAPISLSFPLPFSLSHNRNDGQTQRLDQEASQVQTESQEAIHRPATVTPLATPSYHTGVVRYTDVPLLPATL